MSNLCYYIIYDNLSICYHLVYASFYPPTLSSVYVISWCLWLPIPLLHLWYYFIHDYWLPTTSMICFSLCKFLSPKRCLDCIKSMTSPLLHLWYYFVYDYQSSCHALMLSRIFLDVIKTMPWCYQVYALMLSSLCLDVIKSMPIKYIISSMLASIKLPCLHILKALTYYFIFSK